MAGKLYEVLSLGMRYWFALLGVLLVLRAFLWLWQDHRARKRRLRQLPDAGMIGELLVLSGSEELPEGGVIPLPYEGTLGFVRTADVVVPCNNVAGQHLDFSFQPRLGLLVYPRRGLTCLVDGMPVDSRSKPRRTPLVHNSILTVGEAELQVRLFAGLDTMRRAERQGVVTHPSADGRQRQVGEAPSQRPAATGRPTLFGQPISSDAPPMKRSGRRHGHGS